MTACWDMCTFGWDTFSGGAGCQRCIRPEFCYSGTARWRNYYTWYDSCVATGSVQATGGLCFLSKHKCSHCSCTTYATILDTTGNSAVATRISGTGGSMQAYVFGSFFIGGFRCVQLRKYHAPGCFTIICTTFNFSPAGTHCSWRCSLCRWEIYAEKCSDAKTIVHAYANNRWIPLAHFCWIDTSPLPPGNAGAPFAPHSTAEIEVLCTLIGLPLVAAAVCCAVKIPWCYRAMLPYRIYNRPVMQNLQALANAGCTLPYKVYDRTVQANLEAIATGIRRHVHRGEVQLPFRVSGCHGNLQSNFEALRDAFPEVGEW